MRSQNHEARCTSRFFVVERSHSCSDAPMLDIATKAPSRSLPTRRLDDAGVHQLVFPHLSPTAQAGVARCLPPRRLSSVSAATHAGHPCLSRRESRAVDRHVHIFCRLLCVIADVDQLDLLITTPRLPVRRNLSRTRIAHTAHGSRGNKIRLHRSFWPRSVCSACEQPMRITKASHAQCCGLSVDP